jgi:glycosyltransferase involved in cell wall biosynthesis
VVDGYSTDKTVEIVINFGAKVQQVHGERFRAKNLGLRMARGKYVLFIDSDIELIPIVVEECTRICEVRSDIGGIVIPERSSGKTFWAKVRDFERSFYEKTPIESPRFFRKDLALRVGDFDEDLIFYEEATLSYKITKLGYRVERISLYIIHHEENISLSELIRKRYYYAKTAKIYRKRYRDFATKQLSIPYRLSIYLRSKVFYEKPSLPIGVILMKSVEFMLYLLAHIS